jgi:regulator of sigma E protease
VTATLGTLAGDSAIIGVYRNHQLTEVPTLLDSDGKLGIYAVSDMSRFFKVNHIDYTLLQAIPAGISYGWETLVTYVSSLKILFTKDGAKNLGGFITIATLFPDHWDWLAFWNLTALLAVVLAFMNIIPIPGLDGGHIVITLWEMITRKPVNEKALNVIQNIGMIILLLLLVIANGNDLIKVFNQLMQ